MSDTFKFVLVGSGNIADTYVNSIRNLAGAELVGVVSRSGSKPASLRDGNMPVANTMAALPIDYDAVILATPNGLHHEGAIEAAGLRKHVLTEKVLDVSVANMDAMIAACHANGVKLGVTYQRRMSPDNVAIKELLEQHRLGRIYAADLSVKFFRDQAYYDSADYRGTRDVDGGGPFIQQAVHNLDIYCWFFGVPEKVVSVLGTFCHEVDVEDHGAALLKHGSGMIGTIVASTAARPGFPARLDIHAEVGSIVMENDGITVWEVDGIDNPSRQPDFKVHSGAASASVSDTAGHEAIIRDFVDAVREDRAPAVTGESARMATELVLQIYENAI